jgi:hypothetical protein
VKPGFSDEAAETVNALGSGVPTGEALTVYRFSTPRGAEYEYTIQNEASLLLPPIFRCGYARASLALRCLSALIFSRRAAPVPLSHCTIATMIAYHTLEPLTPQGLLDTSAEAKREAEMRRIELAQEASALSDELNRIGSQFLGAPPRDVDFKLFAFCEIVSARRFEGRRLRVAYEVPAERREEWDVLPLAAAFDARTLLSPPCTDCAARAWLVISAP